MKNIFTRFALIALAAVGLSTAAPALAQTAGTTSTGPTMVENQPQSGSTDMSGWGGFDFGDTLTINTIGQAGHSGVFAAVFQGETGEAGVEKNGGSSVDINQNFSTCDSASCPENGVTASLSAFETGTSYAWAKNTMSGEVAYAEDFGGALAATSFGIGVNACPGGCAAVQQPSGE